MQKLYKLKNSQSKKPILFSVPSCLCSGSMTVTITEVTESAVVSGKRQFSTTSRNSMDNSSESEEDILKKLEGMEAKIRENERYLTMARDVKETKLTEAIREQNTARAFLNEFVDETRGSVSYNASRQLDNVRRLQDQVSNTLNGKIEENNRKISENLRDGNDDNYELTKHNDTLRASLLTYHGKESEKQMGILASPDSNLDRWQRNQLSETKRVVDESTVNAKSAGAYVEEFHKHVDDSLKDVDELDKFKKDLENKEYSDETDSDDSDSEGGGPPSEMMGVWPVRGGDSSTSTNTDLKKVEHSSTNHMGGSTSGAYNENMSFIDFWVFVFNNLGDKKPENSLIDDFADISIEIPDHFWDD